MDGGAGNLYVADRGNHRIQKYDSSGSYVSTLGVTGVSGADNSHFYDPIGIAVDSSGNVYVADMYNYRIQKYDSGGSYVSTLGVTGVYGSDNSHFSLPMGVAVDSVGNVYVADSGNHRIQKYNSAGAYVSTLGVTGVSGTDNSHFYHPNGVAVDSSDNLYVADRVNHRIQKFDANGAYVSTLGVSGVMGEDNSHFRYPNGVVVDASDNLYVIDEDNQRIQKYNSSGAYVGTLGETGVPGNDNSHFSVPYGVAADGSGNVYVADSGNHRIQKFNLLETLTVVGAAGDSTGTITGGSSINCSVAANGSASGTCSEAVAFGSAVVLTATPEAGSYVYWTGCATSSGTTCNVTLNADTTVTASFTLTQLYSVGINKTGSGSGTVSCTPNPVADGLTSSCTVTPDVGYHITSISGCGGIDPGEQADNAGFVYGTGPVTADCTVTAGFAINTYTIGFSHTGNGTFDCDHATVNWGDDFSCTVVPAEGYILEMLSDNSVDVTGLVTGTGYSVTGVSADHTIQAVFQWNPTVLRSSGGVNQTWHTVIQSAYAAAAGGDDILALASNFYEDLNFNRNVSVTLKGGYAADFNSVTGWTVLNGMLTISDGTVIVESLIIQ